MRFQPVKCNMMNLTNLTNNWINKTEAPYTLKGKVLEIVDSIKYLGVIITNDLKWNTHITKFCTKANSDYRKRWRDVISHHPGHSHGYKTVMAALLKANIRMVYLHK